MKRKFVKLNIDVPSTKIDLKRGSEWPLDSAPDLVRHLAGENKGNIMHRLGSEQICTVFEKEIDKVSSETPDVEEDILGDEIPESDASDDLGELPDDDLEIGDI